MRTSLRLPLNIRHALETTISAPLERRSPFKAFTATREGTLQPAAAVL
jgi:hypothetical protein